MLIFMHVHPNLFCFAKTKGILCYMEAICFIDVDKIEDFLYQYLFLNVQSTKKFEVLYL